MFVCMYVCMNLCQNTFSRLGIGRAAVAASLVDLQLFSYSHLCLVFECNLLIILKIKYMYPVR